VGVIEQILHLPYAYAWLPGLVFVAIVGGTYWLMRPTPQLAEGPTADVQTTSLATAAAPKPKDQRNMHRRQGNPIQVHVASPDDKNNPEIGSVLDRSMGGMRLALFGEVAVGTVISIHPLHADAIVPWVDLEVRSCKPSTEMPDQFEVGCQYVKSPPYSIQLLFG
jgi:hypothetical protein